MRDVCQKWKVKLSRRLKQFDGLTRLILTPAPPLILRQIYVTGHPSQIHRDDPPLAVPGEPFQGNSYRRNPHRKIGVCLQVGTGSNATGSRNRAGRAPVVW